MSGAEPRRGVTLGDAVLMLSLVALVFGLAYPRIRRTALLHRAEQAVAHVQAVAEAARRFRDTNERWPHRTRPGETPVELAEYLPTGFTFDRGSYRLNVDVWETAEEAPMQMPDVSSDPAPGAPPEAALPRPTVLFGSFVGVTVHSDEPALLAGLADHFGPDRSFLHGDAWTLVFASEPGR